MVFQALPVNSLQKQDISYIITVKQQLNCKKFAYVKPRMLNLKITGLTTLSYGVSNDWRHEYSCQYMNVLVDCNSLFITLVMI